MPHRDALSSQGCQVGPAVARAFHLASSCRSTLSVHPRVLVKYHLLHVPNIAQCSPYGEHWSRFQDVLLYHNLLIWNCYLTESDVRTPSVSIHWLFLCSRTWISSVVGITDLCLLSTQALSQGTTPISSVGTSFPCCMQACGHVSQGILFTCEVDRSQPSQGQPDFFSLNFSVMERHKYWNWPKLLHPVVNILKKETGSLSTL